jgi:hypothetical protein
LSEVGGEIAKAAALGAVIFGVLFFAGILLVVGLFLFFGEWLFGSLGWGVLHGLLFLTGIAVSALLGILGLGMGRGVRWFAVGAVVAIIAAVILGLALPNQAYSSIGTSVAPNLDPATRPLIVGVVIWAVIGAVVGLIAGLRRGAAGAIGGLIGFGILGAIFGALTAITFDRGAGVALGVTLGLLAWIALMIADLARTGVDVDAMKARFYPSQTIDTTKETLEWLKERMPPARGS